MVKFAGQICLIPLKTSKICEMNNENIIYDPPSGERDHLDEKFSTYLIKHITKLNRHAHQIPK